MRRFSLVTAVAIVVLVGAGCSDDGDDNRGNRPDSSVSSTTTTSPRSDENAACDLVTQHDAEAVFGATARRGAAEDEGTDSVCLWETGDDGEGGYQHLEFRLHEGSSLRTQTTRDGGIVVSEQRAEGGQVFAFRYVSNGGDFEAKRAAVHDLADSVVARAE